MSEVRDATITLSNSIIGVAILAMPYCYAQCGFVLATSLLALIGLATVESCQMLLKSALATKRRSYEFLAHHVYGPVGKLTVELCLIGLSIGTLVAFFVIIGDLSPQVLASLFSLSNAAAVSPISRAVVMATIGTFVILPLSLMRNPSALSKISAISLAFYAAFMLHLTFLAISGVPAVSGTSDGSPDQSSAPVGYRLFRLDGLLTCLPIFSLAFTCQTQLFLLCDSLRDPSIKVMRRILNQSVLGCCLFYMLIGSLGYTAFSTHPVIQGDLMAMYPASPGSDLIKLGFVLSVAVSFPIIAFPCRVSIYSFIYLQTHQHRSGPVGGASDLTTGRVYIPDGKFRGITSAIVFGTLLVGLLIPNVEFILNLTGAITGSVICFILPAGIYASTFSGSRTVRCCSSSSLIKWLGVAILCVGTASTLFSHHAVGADSRPDAAVVQLPKPLPERNQSLKSKLREAGDERAAELKRKLMRPKVQRSDDSDSRQEPPLPDLEREVKPDGRIEAKHRHPKPRSILKHLTTVKSATSTLKTTAVTSTLKPTSGTPTTLKPTSGTPTTLKQTSEAPTSLTPTSGTPTTLKPTSETSTTLKPTSGTSTTLKPTSGTPATLKPTSGTPTTLKPTSGTSTTLKPTSGTSTTLKPTSGTSTKLKPTSGTSTTLKPTSGTPTTLKPTSGTSTSSTPTSASHTTVKLTASNAKTVNRSIETSKDFKLLADLLKEQREQGRRIEEQLKRLEAAAAAAAAADQQEPSSQPRKVEKDSRNSSLTETAKSSTATSIAAKNRSIELLDKRNQTG